MTAASEVIRGAHHLYLVLAAARPYDWRQAVEHRDRAPHIRHDGILQWIPWFALRLQHSQLDAVRKRIDGTGNTS